MEKLRLELDRLIASLHLRRDNIQEFAEYESRSTALLQAIRDAYKRQHSR
jgi:hypothetical protein